MTNIPFQFAWIYVAMVYVIPEEKVIAATIVIFSKPFHKCSNWNELKQILHIYNSYIC